MDEAIGSGANELGDVSAPTVGRLPRYLHALVDLASDGIATVSSTHLAGLVGVNSATLRRDLASLDIGGTRGVGYDVQGVVHAVSVVLGVNQDWPVVVVGAGNLGRALANYGGLAERGFPVEAICDIDEQKVGTTVGPLTVRHLDELAGLIGDHAVAVGVVATPVEAAQEVADQLVTAGIRSILNFTADPLNVPSTVVVRRVDLATELQILSFYQRRSEHAEAGTGLPLADPDEVGQST